ncbi:MAG: sugar phosphate nucleotidyltransferase [Nanoarchaeota archaeon]|nr:sugar phosphate nucleotidyltransferase [Nanoarchaeota archaeon]
MTEDKCKAVILCGGRGTRLKEETEFKPKPLVEIGSMPLLWHIMKIYSHYGHNEFVLPLGYKGDMIKEFFMDFSWRANDFSLNLKSDAVSVHENHKKEDWNIHFVDTGLKSGTGLRLFKVKDFLEGDDNFLLTYGDGVSNVDINKLIDFHKKQKTIATITGVNVYSGFGILKVNNNKVVKFTEKPINQDMINGGFMVFNKRVFDHINDNNSMLEEYGSGLLPKLAKIGEVSVYHHTGFWKSMDNYRDYLELNKIWKEDPRWKVWK